MSERDTDKRVFIIAGPNGAGKTTFATEFLPNEADCIRFINADMIAQGLSPFKPEAAALAAGKVMLREIDRCSREGSRSLSKRRSPPASISGEFGSGVSTATTSV